MVGRAVDRRDLVADQDAGARGRRAVIDVADEPQAVARLGDHADAGIADLAVGREQPAHVVADGMAKDVGKLEIVDRVRLETAGVGGLQAGEDGVDRGVDPRLRACRVDRRARIVDLAPHRLGETVERRDVVEIVDHQPHGAVEHRMAGTRRRPRPRPARPP